MDFFYGFPKIVSEIRQLDNPFPVWPIHNGLHRIKLYRISVSRIILFRSSQFRRPILIKDLFPSLKHCSRSSNNIIIVSKYTLKVFLKLKKKLCYPSLNHEIVFITKKNEHKQLLFLNTKFL